MSGIDWGIAPLQGRLLDRERLLQLNKQFILIDVHEDREDYDVAAGVAIPAECADEFARAVEELAVERFGGASFSELLDNDLDDASMSASAKKNFEDQVDRVLAAAERIMGNGR